MNDNDLLMTALENVQKKNETTLDWNMTKKCSFTPPKNNFTVEFFTKCAKMDCEREVFIV